MYVVKQLFLSISVNNGKVSTSSSKNNGEGFFFFSELATNLIISELI